MAPTLDFGVDPIDIGTFDTSFGSAGADPFGTISYDIPPAGSTLSLDPFLFPDSSAGPSSNLFNLEPDPNGLLVPTQPAPQAATAGSPAGTTWAPLLGFGAPIVSAAVASQLKTGQLQPGNVQLTGANGASVGQRAGGAPLRALFDTTNQGITGQHVVIGGIVLLALIYGINKLV
jgi:hypothetical protein